MKTNKIALCLFVISLSVVMMAQPPASVRVGSDSEDMPCDQANQKVSHPNDLTPSQYQIASDVAQRCYLKQYNKQHPDDPQIGYESVDPGAQKVLFHMVSVNDAAKLRDACKAIIAANGAAASDGDPLLGLVIGAGGQYSCDAYFNSAVNSDPLIIIMPAAIPGYQLTKDTLATLLDKAPVLDKVPGPKVNVGGYDFPVHVIVPPSAVEVVACKVPLFSGHCH